MTARVTSTTWHQRSYVTGPSAVLVSIVFGVAPAEGPRIVIMGPRLGNDASLKFDLKQHIAEVLGGVERVNAEFGGSLQVEAIQVVPDDYPGKLHAMRAAYLIAKCILTGSE